MKINWLTYGEEWAFRYKAEHIQKELQKHEHSENASKADIHVVMSTHLFKRHKPDKKTIVLLDSERGLR